MPFAGIYKMLDERSDLMGRMLDTLGIQQKKCTDVSAARELRSAAQNCMHCRTTKKCRRWLDEQEIVGQGAEPTFCPNYGRFMEWQETKSSEE